MPPGAVRADAPGDRARPGSTRTPGTTAILVIFHNRAVWHSVVGSLRPTDLRIYHQCNLAASEPPIQ